MLPFKNIGGHACSVFGSGKVPLVIEMGLGSTLGEWRQTAQRLSESYTVLLYERRRSTESPRTAENIARELRELRERLGWVDPILLLAHSQGGLYAQQFVRLYPKRVTRLILLDSLCARDGAYKTLLTPKEPKMSGFDQTAKLAMMENLAKLHLGGIIKSVVKNALRFIAIPIFQRMPAAAFFPPLQNRTFMPWHLLHIALPVSNNSPPLYGRRTISRIFAGTYHPYS